MEQTHSKNLQLGQLVANEFSEIERLGYSRTSRNGYFAIWEHLIEFSGRKQLGDEFSADLVARFSEEYRVREQVDTPGTGWRRHIVFGVNVLAGLETLTLVVYSYARLEPPMPLPSSAR